MSKTRCYYCGSESYEARKVEYLYSHQGQYLLVPNTPVEVCSSCGMSFYDAKVLKEIERRFFAIQEHREEPERYLRIPAMAYT
jgi:YgiT-type zinc finger domain-containing protein